MAEALFGTRLEHLQQLHPGFGARRRPKFAFRFKRMIPVVDATTIQLGDKPDAIFGLRCKEDEWFHLRADSQIAGPVNKEKYAAAFLDVLSFRVGKRLGVVAYTQTTHQGKTTVLINHEINKGKRFYPSLPDHDSNATAALFDRGVDFFLKKNCGPVRSALHVCWESRKVTFPAGHLLGCSVVE